LRDKENFRDTLEGLKEMFPDKAVISIAEASELLGSHRQTLLGTKDFPRQKIGKKYVIPLVSLARWLS
jgi:hypothetical protein